MSTDNIEKEVTYPTTPDAEGWYYENEGEAALETETRVDDEGNIFKRIRLKGGKVATMRELNKKESDKAALIAGKNKDMLMCAYIAIGTTIMGKDNTPIKFVAEDLDLWKAADTNRLQAAAAKLNF